MVQFDADTDQEAQKKPWHKTSWFWLRFMPALLTAALIIIGVVLVTTDPNVSIYFEV